MIFGYPILWFHYRSINLLDHYHAMNLGIIIIVVIIFIGI